jgi:putative sigma-54 modulation protein
VEIKISARHGSLSQTTQDKISVKVEKLTRLFERVKSIEVTANLEKADVPEVDIQVLVPPKQLFVARERAEELMAAVDAVIHKLEQQLRKYKEKLQNHHRGESHREQPAPVDVE